MNTIGKTSSMMPVLMVAAAGANRTWAEPEVAGPGDPWVLPHPPLHRETTVRRLDDISVGRCWGWYDRASPDGRHLATLELGDGEGKRAAVTRDGVRGPGYDGFPLGCGCNFLTYSPDSAHLAYPAIRDGKCYVVRDGAEEGPYDADGLRGWFEIAYSPDSRHMAFVLGGSPNKVRVFLDGREVGVSDWVTGLAFSPDSRHLLWCAFDGQSYRAVVDGQPGIGFALPLDHEGNPAEDVNTRVFHFTEPGRVHFLVALTPPDNYDKGTVAVSLVEETL